MTPTDPLEAARRDVVKWLAQWGIHNDAEIGGLLDALIEAAAPRPAELPRCQHGAIREPCVPCSEGTPRPAGVDVEAFENPDPGTRIWRLRNHPETLTLDDAIKQLRWFDRTLLAALTGSEEPARE